MNRRRSFLGHWRTRLHIETTRRQSNPSQPNNMPPKKNKKNATGGESSAVSCEPIARWLTKLRCCILFARPSANQRQRTRPRRPPPDPTRRASPRRSQRINLMRRTVAAISHCRSTIRSTTRPSFTARREWLKSMEPRRPLLRSRLRPRSHQPRHSLKCRQRQPLPPMAPLPSPQRAQRWTLSQPTPQSAPPTEAQARDRAMRAPCT